MRIKHKFIKAGIPIILVLVICTGLSAAHLKKVSVYTPSPLLETTTILSNPYMGWYSLIGYTLSDSEPLSVPTSYLGTDSPTELVLLEINLDNYADCDISEDGLSRLDQLFSSWSDTQKQLILRFVYDWDGNNLQTEPALRSQIERHMEQLAPVINRYANSIYLLQGIFVGNWGEMNHSDYLSGNDLTALTEKLASLTDPSIFLSVRTPAQLRTILKTASPLPESDAYSGSLASRLGLYNDGMLGSPTDTGTYGDSASDTSDYSKAWPRADELTFQNRLCQYVPNGGEVITPNSCNDLDAAIQTLQTMHVSYLNKDYDPDVINKKWKTSLYSGSDLLYHGMTGYDYISCHLGYRYVLTASAFSPGQVSITVENKGFSSCYRPFLVSLTVTSADETWQYTIPIDTDTRTWISGKSVTLKASLADLHLEPSSYTLTLKLTDPSTNREILLASDLPHNTTGYQIGTLTIDTLLSKITK